MRIFRTALAIAFKHPIYLGVYVLFLSLIGSFVTGGAAYVEEDIQTYEPARASLAVIDRDDSDLSEALVGYLSRIHDVADVPDEEFALQDALATNQVDAVIIVPQGFEDDCLSAARSDGELPRLQVAYGGYTQASAFAEQQAARWVSLAGAEAALEPEASAAEVAAAVDAAAGRRADVEVEAAEVATSSAYPLQTYLSFSTYTLMCSVVVCVGLVLSKMTEPDVRRRMLASPLRPRRLGLHMLLGCLVITVGVWAATSAVGVVSSGIGTFVAAPAQVMLALVAMLVFALVPLSVAFMLAMLGVGEEGLNALGNIGGLIMSFLGGAWVPIALLGDAVQTAARFSPAFWTNEAVASLLSAPQLTADVLAEAGCGMGITALFAVAFAAIGLAAARSRPVQ